MAPMTSPAPATTIKDSAKNSLSSDLMLLVDVPTTSNDSCIKHEEKQDQQKEKDDPEKIKYSSSTGKRRRSLWDVDHICSPLHKQQKVYVVAAGLPHPLAEDVEGVLRTILLLMPLQKLIQFRNVNRLWRSLLTSTSFLQEWEENHSNWVVMERKVELGMELLAYDGKARSWMNLSSILASHGQSGSGGHGEEEATAGTQAALFHTRDEKWLVAGFSDVPGLLCFLVGREDAVKQRIYIREILLLNPLTGFNTALPLPSPSLYFNHIKSHLYLYLHCDPTHPRHYSIFLFVRQHLYVYSSRHKSWEATLFSTTNHFSHFTSIDIRLDVPPADQPTCLAYKPKLHSDGWTVLTLQDLHQNLPVYDSKGFCCTRVDRTVHDQYSFRHGGRLFLAVADVCPGASSEEHILRGFSVYQMRSRTNVNYISATDGTQSSSSDNDQEWSKIASTPAHLWERFPLPLSGQYHMHFNFVYVGGHVYMTAVLHGEGTLDLSPFPYDNEHGFQPMFISSSPLVYDMGADSWHQAWPPPDKRAVDNSPILFIRPLCTMRPSFSMIYDPPEVRKASAHVVSERLQGSLCIDLLKA